MNTMITTQHLLARMSKRAIRKSDLDIVMSFGYVVGDKVVLDKQTARERLEELKFILDKKQGQKKWS